MTMKKYWVIVVILTVICIALWAMGADAADVTIKWDANTEPDMAGYKIYYDTDSGAPYTGTEATQGPSPIVVPLGSFVNCAAPEYTVSGLPNTNIYFVVTAYDTEALESDYSNEVSSYDAFIGQPPLPPGTLKVTNITNYGTVIINQ